MGNTGNAVIDADSFRAAMAQFADLLAENEQLLNDLNVYPVPDSDTGSNTLQTLKFGLAKSHQQTNDLGEFALSFATGAAKSAMGNSGVILAQYLHGLAQGLSQTATPTQCTPQEWQNSLQQAATWARQAVLTPAEGTMLTVADSAAKIVAQSDLKQYYEEIQEAVRASVIDTENILPALTAAKVIDAGALALSFLHDGFASILGINVSPLEVTTSKKAEAEYSGPAFELMFSVICSQSMKTDIETSLSSLGESISISGLEPNFNFHIHTNTPEIVIESFEEKVEITNIRISELSN